MPIARVLIVASMRSGSSISQAESPAGRMRMGTSLRAMGRAAGLERREQLLGDALEATGRHHDDEGSVPGLLRDGRDDLVHLRGIARVLAGPLQVGDEPLPPQPPIRP